MKEKKTTYRRTIAVLSVLLLAAAVGSAALGRYPIGIRELFGILGSKIFHTEAFWTPTQESLLLVHRLPRILLACLVGCCLSAAGASYQGVFQNPMAAPDILGASSGAAFGAALAILLGFGGAIRIAFSFTASLLTVLLVLFIGNRVKGKRVVGLILTGIMISSLVSSETSFIKLIADPQDQLPAITYWLMGSLNGAQPEDVKLAVIPMLPGLIPLLLLRWRLNLLTFGDEEAKTMGVNTQRLRAVVVLCAALITAASVSVSGTIGWVGLVIPHLARKLVGSNYKALLPASMLMGALFLLITDDISRTLFAAEIPIGILTSLIGVPFFLFLIIKDGEKL